MATGNLFLGYGRGSVGDVTLSRVKGQQTARARNRRPNNPRTNAQVAQRAVFAAAVGFYKESTQAFFKFAYEDRRERESDFNAFMRYNTKRGIPAPPQWRDTLFPYIGPWVMSNGRMSSLSVVTNAPAPISGQVALRIGGFSPAAAGAPTLGEVSRAFIAAYPEAQNGDVVTLYGQFFDTNEVITAQNLSVLLEPETLLSGEADVVGQFILDTASTKAFSETAVRIAVYAGESASHLQVAAPLVGSLSGSNMSMAAVLSRPSSNSLVVSRSELVLGSDAQSLYTLLTDTAATAWTEIVEREWKASGQAVLEGSLAE